MSPVGGSRHYQGTGLGHAAWECPSCGAENAGPIAQGCQLCGAGKPGHKVVEPTPQPQPEPVQQGDFADYWAAEHAGISVADAYRAGYLAGAREAQEKAMHAPPVTADVERLAPEGKPARTMVAALTFFRDQVLSERPEEVESGEWCSLNEINELIAGIRETYHV